MSIVVIDSLKKNFQMGTETIEVLKNIKLSVDPGTTIVITGESGSGKSTLLNLIGGIDTPSRGTISVHDLEITRLDEEELTIFRNKTIGFIFQFHFLLKDFSAIENVMMPAYIAGIPAKESRQKASDLLAEVGLSKRENHYLVELSGGERQRVAVARALMNDPKIIIADEPTGNLDEMNSHIVEDILFTLVEKHHKTMLLVTHDTNLARRANYHYKIEHGVLAKVC
jgi:lipoprotein-releasing system ATP-binding protein